MPRSNPNSRATLSPILCASTIPSVPPRSVVGASNLHPAEVTLSSAAQPTLFSFHRLHRLYIGETAFPNSSTFLAHKRPLRTKRGPDRSPVGRLNKAHDTMASHNHHPPIHRRDSQNDSTSSRDFITHPLADELVQWFTREGGFFSHDVQIVHNESHGFHARAVRPLTSPTLASCPLKLTFSSLNLDPNQMDVPHVDSSLRQCHGKIPNHILTYLLLIEQRAKGKDSPWHAYIACLPQPESMNTPLWFTEEDSAFLVGTNLSPAASERKDEMRRQWEQAISVMKELRIPSAEDIDFESLLWAATIFTSRAFISSHILPDRETTPLLFPVVDILNHSMSAKVVWDFQPRDSFTLKCLEGDAIKAGDELFNNYAPKQNGELLLGYGFCLEDNPIEQFALRLAFPPMLQEYAQESGLLKPEYVPFDMPTEFLKTDPKTEQHFLRAKGHAFGRYENNIPFFRGIPPSIVHLFFVQTMLTLDLEVSSVNVKHPSIRIVLQVLVLLHQAIEQRCLKLPLVIQQEPKNEKQRYAKMYRDAQASIIHSIRHELKAVVDKVRPRSDHLPPRRPILLTTAEAVKVLQVEFPAATEIFKQGLKEHHLQGLEDETIIWTILLIIFASQILKCPADDTLISTWLHDLFIRQPLPAIEDGIEDAETYNFIDSHLADFLRLPSPDADASPTDILDDLGLAAQQLSSQHPPKDSKFTLLSSPTENLGVRLIMWAMLVAEQELLPVFEDGVVCKCLYARPWTAEIGGREDEKWIYDDADDHDYEVVAEG